MFRKIKENVDHQFSAMCVLTDQLYRVDLDRDALFSAYLDVLPEDQRQEHNCNCCKSFLRNYGDVVAIAGGRVHTMWEFDTDAPYDKVPEALHQLVVNAPIKGIFVSHEQHLGTDYNIQIVSETENIRWEHFSFVLPKAKVHRGDSSVAEVMGAAAGVRNVFKRSLDELTLEAIDTVLDLISQNSLPRGAEFKKVVESFRTHKVAYADLPEGLKQELYAWEHFRDGGKIRNTAIGTLLVNLSEDMPLDKAVKTWDTIMAPTNYRRPKALATKGMMEAAEKDFKEMGLTPALFRRHAVLDDIPLDEVLFVDKGVRETGVFAELKQNLVENAKSFSAVEEVPIDTFLKDILPKASNIEVLFEGRHAGRLMSLIAPQTIGECPLLFNWDNEFSWDYKGNLADSMEQRVKAAGGNIVAELRYSIQWNDGDDNQNDFDAWALEPTGNKIYFPTKGRVQMSSGMLDVDVRRPGPNVAVENITWTDRSMMPAGKYQLKVHNFSHNGGTTGFTAQVAFDDTIHTFTYDRELLRSQVVHVATVVKDHKGAFTLDTSDTPTTMQVGEGSTLTQQVWGAQTNTFHKVAMIMNSPNHWGDNEQGNRHTFFILDGVKNDEKPRTMFNEFLRPELSKHRKTIEMLGSKLKAEVSDNQLSGLGFSSTHRAEVIVKISGAFTRIIKVKF